MIPMNAEPAHQHPSNWLSEDRPIQSRSEDALGRRGFSDAIAEAIRRWTGRESLVIALYGPWGSGKSSLKNMVTESIGIGSPPIQVVDFNPWQLANRPSLSEAFFDELGIAFGKGDLGTNAHKKTVLNRYRRLTRRLQGGSDLAVATRNLLGLVLVISGVLAFGSYWAQPRFVSVGLAVLLVLAGLLTLMGKVTAALATILEAGTDVGEKSTNEIKQELAEDLKQLKTPILVVLDDLDRLTPQETIDVFQLVKANGDFPNLIYLILCDRIVIEANINEALKMPGREYLEKIVQVAFDVPMIDVTRVRKVLFNRLGSLVSGEVVSARFHKKRWANVFWAGLHVYFTTLRDVNRFLSTLAFQMSFFTADGILEVNPIDLIVIESLRLFEPEVYNALRSSKGLLTEGRPEGHDSKSRGGCSEIDYRPGIDRAQERTPCSN